MASVAFKLTTSAKVNTIPIVDGQLVFVQPEQGQTVGKLYLDFHNTRTQYGSTGSAPEPDPHATHFLGESSTDPETGTVTIDGTAVDPNWGDMVTYNNATWLYHDNDWVKIGSVSTSNVDPFATHYKGIMDSGFDPTDSSTWFINRVAFTPDERDIVAYEKKEYIYRPDENDNDTLKFFELGDEDSQKWEIEE